MSSIIKLKPVKKDDLKYSFKRFVFREMFYNRERKLKNNLMESLIEFSKLHDKKLTKKESKEITRRKNKNIYSRCCSNQTRISRSIF